MLNIFIDADACPVKDETYKVAGRYGLKVFVIANQWIQIPLDPQIEMIVVKGGFGFTFAFTTEASKKTSDTAYVQPGKTYYINIRNDSCKVGKICSIDGQYRNWGF